MPDYSENDLKAIEGLMVFDDVRTPPANGPSLAHRFTISYAKADRDQFARLMNFELPIRPAQPAVWRENELTATDDKPADRQPFYTSSDVALFERVALPTESVFASRTPPRHTEPPKEPSYTSGDLEIFSNLTQFPSGTTEQPVPIRRENIERAAMKIVDVDRERAAKRRNFWGTQAGMKIVFSDAERIRGH